ncbi:DUF1508 domain-containing protein [Sphingorhabdus contaminans]|uniref:DUF1508 domain-containing protein n=2 Tax=Sphingorhabdus contaminans TaxID=1343899 RepID=A0A553WA97_9SPHN|nr:DUF1508 domain-containing protein [Sphingorhabdus contaminans]TSB01610.1 DUF1508 domain-containing protein [Sphingorhabdus contaminans]
MGRSIVAQRPYPSFLIYLDANRQFRWKLEAANGKIIANCGEGYHNLSDCEHGISLVQKSATYPTWETQEVTDRRRR